MYACLGNHEYYSGIDGSVDFYREAGITLLRDSAATVGGITIVGRDDRSNPRRKSIGALMRGVDKSKYVILLDHQPYHLEQAERAGVDFQLSGHTHHGQVWPISWITQSVYEDAYGPGGAAVRATMSARAWASGARNSASARVREYIVATFGGK